MFFIKTEIKYEEFHFNNQTNLYTTVHVIQLNMGKPKFILGG